MKKILIIEDDLFIRENVFEVLELSGYDVYTASNGKEGLDKAFEVMPDLIICDIMMPIMDGYEVRKRLTENIRTKTIPFVFLTAKTEIKELRHGMSLGADDYITKPFEVQDLLNSISIRFEKIENLKDLFRLEGISGVGEESEIELKNDESQKHITYKEIVLIRSDGTNSEITRYGNERFSIQKSLKYWEVTLPEKNFIRIPPSVIFNSDFVTGIEKKGEEGYLIHLKEYPEPVLVGNQHYNKIKHLDD